jgi:hypothetical protein
MEMPEVVAVECPNCGEPVNIVVGKFEWFGAVERRECTDGHVFWIRFGSETERRIVVMGEPPAPADRA